MASERWTRAKKVFNAMVEAEPASPSAWLADRCGEDDALREEVHALWTAYEEGPLTEDAEASDWVGATTEEGLGIGDSFEQRPAAGTRIGGYRLNEEVGVGGMSVVYRAERVDVEFEQTVAIKLLQRRLHSGDAEQRFRTEQQVLASLEHPNIAGLLDGGVTDGGRPYLVMEYVDGLPVTEYIDDHDLDVRARLDLLVQVADAVQAAHGSLVVHRDLKPSNVLVTETPSGPQVRLLDFGIAKLLDDSLPVTRPVTVTGHHLLTPSYAAPEQLTGGEITTRTDVYQLGVLAYELLSGMRPFDLTDRSLTEVEQILVKETPEPPSEQTGDGAVPSRYLEGDLDMIVMKALRKEPGRRYRSVEAFVADLQRYRNREPIHARPATLRYRASKFARRYRWGLATTALVMGLVIGALVVVVQERNQAQREAEKAEQVSSFLTALFEAPDPNHSKGDTLTARQLLGRGQERLDQLEEEPAVEAQMMYVLGQSHRRLAHYDAADTLLQQSLIKRTKLHGHIHPATLESLTALALLRRDRGAYRAADTLLERVVSGRRALRGPSHPSVVKGLMYRSFVQRRRSDLAGAAKSIREALRAKQNQGGEPDMLTAELLFNQAAVLRQQGRYEEALPVQERSLSLARERTNGPHPGVVANLGNLALLHRKRRGYAAADSIYRLAIEEATALYGKDHPETALWTGNLGTMYVDQYRYAEADSLIRRALSINRSIYESPHPRIVLNLSNLAKNQYRRGHYVAAASTYRKAVRMGRQVYTSPSLQEAQLALDYGQFLMTTDRLDSAATYIQRGVEINRDLRPDDHSDRADALVRLAALRVRQGQEAAADSLLSEALDIYESEAQQPMVDAGTALRLRGRLAFRQGELSRADSLFEEAVQAFGSSLAARFGHRATVRTLRGISKMKRGEYAAADSLLTRSLEILRHIRGPNNRFTKRADRALRSLHEGPNQPEKASPFEDERGRAVGIRY